MKVHGNWKGTERITQADYAGQRWYNIYKLFVTFYKFVKERYWNVYYNVYKQKIRSRWNEGNGIKSEEKFKGKSKEKLIYIELYSYM